MNSVSPNWKFSELLTNGKGKKLIVIGDSLSAEETYNNAGKTYCSVIAEKTGMIFKKNYAIGGTTATYMFPGSHVEIEYKDHKVAIDGCRVSKKAFENHEFDDVDYAFIEYGHNDQYFNDPISVPGDDVYNIDNFDNAHSFKGSYRFIINLLRKANPNIRIILMNCTYSEYDLEYRSKDWKYTLTFADYRQAIKELAEEMNCKYLEPWDYMKPVFDGRTTKEYYHDVCHISPKGHAYLAEFIMKN